MNSNLDYFAYIVPLLTKEECGDAAVFIESSQSLFFCLIDVLGHGADAYSIALRSKAYLYDNVGLDLIELTYGLHNHLMGSRGIACNLGRINLSTDHNVTYMEYVNIGNILSGMYGESSYRLLNQSGIIGDTIPTPKKHKVELVKGDVLVMITDGISERIDRKNLQSMINRSSETLATHIITNYSKGNDDAACMLIKYRP